MLSGILLVVAVVPFLQAPMELVGSVDLVGVEMLMLHIMGMEHLLRQTQVVVAVDLHINMLEVMVDLALFLSHTPLDKYLKK